MRTLHELAQTYECLAADAEALADRIMARAALEGTAQRSLREFARETYALRAIPNEQALSTVPHPSVDCSRSFTARL